MRHSTKKAGRGGERSTFGLLASGAGTIDFSQRMTLTRKALTSGSVAADWKIVGGDLRGAIARTKRDLERV